jgi:predicted permease
MRSIAQDLRYAARLLLRSPGFTVIAVLALALGIGANAAVFSVIDAVLLAPLPYLQPQRLMAMFSTFPDQGFDHFWISPPEYLEYREMTRSFGDLGAYVADTVNVAGSASPVRVPAADVSASLFTTLGVHPELGRFFAAAEDVPNAEPVTVLGDALWRRAFGADPGIVGRRILVDGVARTVVGVMPAGFEFGSQHAALWLPLALGPVNPTRRGNHFLYIVGRLRPETTLAQARRELEGILVRWHEVRPNAHVPSPDHHRLVIRPLIDELVGDVRPKLRLVWSAVALVLLIACANVANLQLARAEARQREIAIRTALGAGHGRLVRQLMTESVLLALLGGLLGLALAVWGVRALVASNPEGLPRLGEIGLDPRAFGFTLLVSVGTGLLFGLAPALHARAGAFFAALKAGGARTTAGSSRQRVRRVLVVAEVTLAAVLLIGAGLLIRSFWELNRVDPGFRPAGLLSFQVSLPQASYGRAEQVAAFYRRLIDDLAGLPGVSGAAAMTGMPPKREVNANDTILESVPMDPKGPAHNVDYYQAVTPEYFRTLGIPLRQGRLFRASDGLGAPGVVVINETMAKVFWPRKSPLGERLRVSNTSPWLTIAGIVKDVKQGGLDQKTGSELYFPIAQVPAGGAAPAIRKASPRRRAPPWCAWTPRCRSPGCARSPPWWRSRWRSRASSCCLSSSSPPWRWSSPPSASTASSPTPSSSGRRRSACAWRSAPRCGRCSAWCSPRARAWRWPASGSACCSPCCCAGPSPACSSASRRATPSPSSASGWCSRASPSPPATSPPAAPPASIPSPPSEPSSSGDGSRDRCLLILY